MTLNPLQVVRAAAEMLWEPSNYNAGIRLADALMRWEPMRRRYERMVEGLRPQQREHLRELTLRSFPLEYLEKLPGNTLGAQYAAFMRANNLSDNAQIETFAPVAEVLRESWVAVRFGRVHDLHHVLMGFDVNLPGEMGLQAFNFRNFREPFGFLTLVGTPWVIARCGQAPKLLGEMWRGWRLGGQVENLLVAPLEEYFERDLAEVRQLLKIPEPRDSGAGAHFSARAST
jgi:ubiquinone biosynthesis protein Coq4